MKGLALLLGSPKGMGKGKPMPGKSMADDDEEESSEGMGGGAKERAVRDFFTKGNAGDYKGAAAAAQRLYDACAMGGGESDEEEEA
jgi:hypothetical protein